mgnify:FL=1
MSSPSYTELLDLDSDSLTTCVACGLCLPHCPTFRLTGDERMSPRGRIALMLALQTGEAACDDEWYNSMETCMQCRGCEAACPAGVPFGELISGARAAISDARPLPLHLRIGLWALTRPRLLLTGSRLVALLQRLRMLPRVTFLPRRLPLSGSSLPRRTEGDVILFTGCVMDVWQPEVHDACESVIEVTGSTVLRSGPRTGCCGALHEHAGLHDSARELAEHVIATLQGDQQVLVDSAGCGAALKAYGDLLGTPEAKVFSERVLDVHEWLAERSDALPLVDVSGRPAVIVQDPCHLRHVQDAHGAVRQVLGHCSEVVELNDDGLCCGAGGSYSLLQPVMATAARDRKVELIRDVSARSGANIVVSANPGCSMHLATAGIEVLHPIQVLAGMLASPGEVVGGSPAGPAGGADGR